MSAVKQLNEAMNHFHLGAEALNPEMSPSSALKAQKVAPSSQTADTFKADHAKLISGNVHPSLWPLPHIDHFAFSLDHIIKANPQLTEIRTAQSLLFHLTGKVHLAREALK